MDDFSLKELFEDFTGSEDDEQKLHVLMKRCHTASNCELEDFVNELSELLCNSFESHIPTLKAFLSQLLEKYSKRPTLLTRYNAVFQNFPSLLTNCIIMQNLHQCDFPGFREIFDYCFELLWRAQNNKIAIQTTKDILIKILDSDGVLGVLISGSHGRHCLKRILFELNINNRIDKEKLLKAVDMVAIIVEQCSEHEEVSPRLSETLSIYKACSTLLDKFRSYQNAERSLLHILCDNDEPHFTLLGISAPKKSSDIPHYLHALEQQKLNLFQKQALVRFSPDKYSSLMEEEELTSINRTFRLPFEFDEDDKLGPWDILISEDAIKDMLYLESPLKIKAVMKKLGNISSGAWEKHGLKYTVPFLSIPVYETELHDHGGLKIFWQVDYGFSVRSYLLTQLVKIWAVTANQTQIDKILEYLKMLHQVYTDEQIFRCTVQQIGRNDIILPKIFGDEGTKSTENKFYSSKMDDEMLLEIHKMLVTNKFIPLSKNLFKSLIMGGADFTFQVSKVEYEIINNPTSAIIIGRSGTGKTTCIVYRLLASYLNDSTYPFYKTPCSHKRQIFITVSRNLCRRVKEYFYRLRESAALAKTKMTIAQFHEYARKKEEEDCGANLTDDKMDEEGDDDKDLSDIPNSFSQLTEDHFPLFITYKKFSEMLEGTYGIDTRKLIQQSKVDRDNEDAYNDEEKEFYHKSFFVNTSWAHFVDYDVFKKKYWNRFNEDKLDCELVYSEFSIIKGSNPEGEYLSREDYQVISTKKYPVFCHNRDKIYDLFQRYEKLKAINGDYDSIDRTLAILRCATKKALGSPHIHEVYIDECQDNQIVDFGLILKIFNRVDSIFLAGDIAQCIAKGSSFRFQDIRSLMYKWEFDRIQINNIPRGTIKPKQFELNINYRSHNGILLLASSIIALIRTFFPESIDHLSDERGEVGGPRPIVFKGSQAENSHLNAFSASENTGNYIEFGAEQVIIVRNEESKSRVKQSIGEKAGLVMTVFETKGMEFNDVLLYNFFTDSPGCQKWRVILSEVKDQSEGVPTFSHEKHYILSSELKHLYVAVTRARQHIWIFDEKSECIEPICKYWEQDGLVKVVRSGGKINTLPTLAKKSSAAEWKRKGKKFFELRQYEQAIFCFEKSGDNEILKLSVAYHLQQIARASINDSDWNIVTSNFNRAAEAFQKCSRPIQSASCYEDINMYEKAAKVYVEWNMFEHAARCYLKVPNFENAGMYFEKSNKYTEAVVAYKDGRRYEKIINLMQSHKENIDEKIFNRMTRLVNIHYRRVNDTKMSEKALSILPTQDEQINLLREHAPEELQEICKKSGQFHVAAEDLRLRGKFNEAADMFLCSDDNKDDIIESLRCCLYLCRVEALKKTMTDFVNLNSSEGLSEQLSKAINIITKVKLESEELSNLKEELQLYLAYMNSDLNEIRKFMQLFRRREDCVTEFRAVTISIWLHISKFDIQAENWRELLLCLLRLCELSFPFLDPRENENIAKINKDFQDIFVVSEVENRPQKRKISSENHLVPFLNQNIVEDAVEILDNWHVYDESTLDLAISQFLASYIYELIQEVGQIGRQIQDISSEICFKFSSCLKQDCRRHHVIPTPSILRKRFTLACLQYTVMQQLDVFLYRDRRHLLKAEQRELIRGSQRWWAERLVKIHIRYQSPQTSCPEVTYAVLAELPKRTRYRLIVLSHKIWLRDVIDNPSDFSVMLKCILVLHQIQDYWGIDIFDWEMSKKLILRHPKELPTGFVHYLEDYEAVPVGNRLSLFFSNLYDNRVSAAIMHIRIFIQYTIDNIERININTPDAFADLISLVEFKTSLVFAISPGYCDFCLPRAYLVNHFDVFTAEPLIPNQHGYNRAYYLAEINNSINQVQQLLNLLILVGQLYLPIILRLIRLLALIGLNEPTSSTRIFNLFKYWSKLLKNKIFSAKLLIYLNESYMDQLAINLHNDLKETDCDSLVIVHYHWGGLSKFSNLEEHGIVKLKYNSVEQFHFALRQIISPIVTEGSASNIQMNQLSRKPDDHRQQKIVIGNEDDQNSEMSKEAQESATESQAWFCRIHDSPQAKESATKIQVWFRRALQRQESRQHESDQILEKIFNEMVVFCKNELYWKAAVEKKGKKRVNKYHILLRGLVVKNIADLTKMQGKMYATKIKLQKAINNHDSDDQKIEICLELLDDFKYKHYENVKLVLDLLSISENTTKHQEANIEWLKNESQMADNFLNDAYHWVVKCNDAMKK
ncbi:5171_t:CDS:10 [Ambispora gerdemannii]|uniref:5171_t:CDS:1 n=1 Tax=Ambispora gerdemannii TaxID=144530 RepID=A0A9N9B3N3_9GLOM|nr:5171_t:CDS:10 [Ambispora gerdemannii]